MNPALWGVLSALSFGCADFIARFTSRGLGPGRSLFGILIVSGIILTAYVLTTGIGTIEVSAELWLIGLHGLALTVAMLLLYWALARGPINVVAPVVATHPALIVAWALILGTRPSALQWTGMAVTMLGAITVAWSAEATSAKASPSGHDQKELRQTMLISLAASCAYAAYIVLGQSAVPIYGSITTLWLGRLVALTALLPFFLLRSEVPVLPLRWWPILLVQGCLDTGGLLFLLLGSRGTDTEITAVVASGFGAVTVLLAWYFLKERMSWIQWIGVGLVFAGTAVLAGSG